MRTSPDGRETARGGTLSCKTAFTEPARVLQRLRGDGLITLKGKHLVILDPERLIAFSGFTPNYLHLAAPNGVAERSR